MENLRTLKNEILTLLVKKRKLDREEILKISNQDEKLANAALSDFKEYNLASITEIDNCICPVLCLTATERADKLYAEGGF